MGCKVNIDGKLVDMTREQVRDYFGQLSDADKKEFIENLKTTNQETNENDQIIPTSTIEAIESKADDPLVEEGDGGNSVGGEVKNDYEMSSSEYEAERKSSMPIFNKARQIANKILSWSGTNGLYEKYLNSIGVKPNEKGVYEDTSINDIDGYMKFLLKEKTDLFTKEDYGTYLKYKDFMDRGIDPDWQNHETRVSVALSEGKKIPSEVLSEYPELKEQSLKEQPKAESGASTQNQEQLIEVVQEIDTILNQTKDQQARSSGQKIIIDGSIVKRQEPLNFNFGSDGIVQFTKTVEVPFKYSIIEADQLQPTHNNGIINQNHFLPEAQPRDRSLKELANEAKEKSDDLKPRLLLDNTNAYYGSPNINRRGEVIQGTGRSEALKYYYKNDNSDSKGYRQTLIDNAQRLGINPSTISGYKNPILVRVIDTTDEDAIILGNYTQEDLEDIKQKKARYKAILGKLNDKDIQEFISYFNTKNSDDDTLRVLIRNNHKPILNKLISLGAIKPQLLGQYVGENGISSDGIEEIYNIFQQFLFIDGDNDLQKKFEELRDDQKKAIEKSIPSILSNKIFKQKIQKTIELLYDHRSQGQGVSIGQWLNQVDIFNGATPNQNNDPEILRLAENINNSGQNEIAYNLSEIAKAMNGTMETTLFDLPKPPISFVEATKNWYSKQGVLQEDGKTRLEWANTKRAVNAQSQSQQITPIDNESYDVLVNGLLQAFPDSKLLTDEEAQQILANQLPVNDLTTTKGDVYGFEYNGNIYLNKEFINSNTPIHEFGHIWINNLRTSKDPLAQKILAKGVSLLYDTEQGMMYLSEVQNDPLYANLSQSKQEDEALAKIIGDAGEVIYNDAYKEVKNKGFFAKAKDFYNDVMTFVASKLPNFKSSDIKNMTFNEFANAMVNDVMNGELYQAIDNPDIAESYRIDHKAPNADNTPLFDLSNAYGDDIYDNKAYYYFGDGNIPMDKKSASILQSIKSKPDSMVTVYRAVPKEINTINSGDWVSINKDYARSHGVSHVGKGFKILSMSLPARQVFTDGNSLHEQGIMFNDINFQVIGINAKLKEDVRNNLDIATQLESEGKTPNEVFYATGWQRGKDQKWRYETDDSKAKLTYSIRDLKNNGVQVDDVMKLGYLMTDYETFEAYPELKNMDVVFYTNGNLNDWGGYDVGNDKIRLNINTGLNNEQTRRLLMHEVQHAIQIREYFNGGGSYERILHSVYKQRNLRDETFRNLPSDEREEIEAEAYNIYIKLSGEVEAFNVEKRAELTAEERRSIPLYKTEDVDREDQILYFSDKDENTDVVSRYHNDKEFVNKSVINLARDLNIPFKIPYVYAFDNNNNLPIANAKKVQGIVDSLYLNEEMKNIYPKEIAVFSLGTLSNNGIALPLSNFSSFNIREGVEVSQVTEDYFYNEMFEEGSINAQNRVKADMTQMEYAKKLFNDFQDAKNVVLISGINSDVNSTNYTLEMFSPSQYTFVKNSVRTDQYLMQKKHDSIVGFESNKRDDIANRKIIDSLRSKPLESNINSYDTTEYEMYNNGFKNQEKTELKKDSITNTHIDFVSMFDKIGVRLTEDQYYAIKEQIFNEYKNNYFKSKGLKTLNDRQGFINDMDKKINGRDIATLYGKLDAKFDNELSDYLLLKGSTLNSTNSLLVQKASNDYLSKLANFYKTPLSLDNRQKTNLLLSTLDNSNEFDDLLLDDNGKINDNMLNFIADNNPTQLFDYKTYQKGGILGIDTIFSPVDTDNYKNNRQKC